MTTKLDESQLRVLIKESMKEVINSEFMKLRAFLLPNVSQKEQREIERLYKTPSRKIAKSYKLKI